MMKLHPSAIPVALVAVIVIVGGLFVARFITPPLASVSCQQLHYCNTKTKKTGITCAGSVLARKCTNCIFIAATAAQEDIDATIAPCKKAAK